MKSLNGLVTGMPQAIPQAANLVWGTYAERLCAVDALAATRDRRVLPLLCARIADPCQEVVARILAGIDFVDPITAVLVGREMTCDGRQDHLQVALAYFQGQAPWELPQNAPTPQDTIAQVPESHDAARLRRALVARHPGIRRAAARRLAVVAPAVSLSDLDVHLLGITAVPPEGILEVLVRTQRIFTWMYAEAAANSWSPESYRLLEGLARIGGQGKDILLSLLGKMDYGPVEEALFHYRPLDLLAYCRVSLLFGEPARSKRAVSILSNFVCVRAATSRCLQARALALLVTGLDRPQPALKAQILHALARSADPASLPIDAVKMLRHRDFQVSCAALKLLAAQGPDRAIEVAGRILAYEGHHVLLRDEALRILARFDPDHCVERAQAVMHEGNSTLLETALESLEDVDVPESLCDEGCQHLQLATGMMGRVLVDWMLRRFPERSTQILMSALASETPAVQNIAAGVLFGCGEDGP